MNRQAGFFAWKPALLLAMALAISGCGSNDDTQTTPVPRDSDLDSIDDELDNCPTVFNPKQKDSDANGIGDACQNSNNPTPSPQATAAPQPSPTTAPTSTPLASSPSATPTAAPPSPAPSAPATATPPASPTPTAAATASATPTPSAAPSTAQPFPTATPAASPQPVPDAPEPGPLPFVPGLDDHGNTSSSATPLKLGTPMWGYLEMIGDQDVFSVDLPAAGRYTFDIQGFNTDSLEAQLRGPDNQNHTLTYARDGNGAYTAFDIAAPGRYNVTVSSPPTGTGGYYVSASEPVETWSNAYRLLRQTTFGPVQQDLQYVVDFGVYRWLDQQLALPAANADNTRKTQLERTIDIATAVEPGADWFPSNPNNSAAASQGEHFNGSASRYTDEYQLSSWYENALHAPDQLRQRVAYALSQILVVSLNNSQLALRPEALAHYYDLLVEHAFGNYRELLSAMARSPAMGFYLSHQGNQKANTSRNTVPDENFARELMQLFTIGLYQLNADGTPQRDADGQLIPSYSQIDVEEMARVMTGWDLRHNSSFGRSDGSFVHMMEFSADYHDFDAKQILGHTIEAGLQDGADLEAALELLFEHDNTAPFVARHLIQRLVTSNPTPDYVARIAAVFADNGKGVRGDLAAVTRAIVLDNQARNPFGPAVEYFGKAREHVIAYTAWLRAFAAAPLNGWHASGESAGVAVDGIYRIATESALGQAPLRAASVFNFYSPDFVPADAYYRDADPQFVLPEMQLRIANNVAGLARVLNLGSYVLEKHAIEREYGSVDDFVAAENARETPNWRRFPLLAILDYGPALEAFEMAMEGDNNGDFSRINDQDIDANGKTPKQRGVLGLIDFLQQHMLGGTPLDPAFRNTVVPLLDSGGYFERPASQAAIEAERVCAAAIQMVFMSSTNMTQK